MDSKAFLKWSFSLRLIILGVVIVPIAMSGVIVWLPPAQVTVTQGEAFVSLSAQPNYVLFRNGCTTVQWDSGNIREIAWPNDEGTIGVGERQLCVEPAHMPTLTATLADESRLVARLDVPIVSEQPLVIGVALVGLMLIGAGVLFLPPIASRVQAADRQTIAHGVVLALILIGALAVRILFVNRGLRGDEAFSYLKYGLQPLAAIRADYSDVNNHILHSQLMRLSSLALGSAPWVWRLPAMISGWLIVPLTYAIGRGLYNRQSGLIAAAFVAFHPYLINFSVNARGYTLLTVAVLLVMVAGLMRDGWRWWIGLGVVAISAAAGFATVPVFLYPMLGLGVWLAWVAWNDAQRWRKLIGLTVSLAIGAWLTLFYYGAVLQAGGFDILTSNRYVQRAPLIAAYETSLQNMLTMHTAISNGLPLLAVIGLYALTVWGWVVYARQRPTDTLAPLLMIGVMVLGSMALRYGMHPRGWLFVVVWVGLSAAAGLAMLVQRWQWGAIGAALALTLIMGAYATLTDVVLQTDSTGDAFGARETTAYFADLRTDDPTLEIAIFALFSAEFPLQYEYQHAELYPLPHRLESGWVDVVNPIVERQQTGDNVRFFALFPDAAAMTVDDYMPTVDAALREDIRMTLIDTFENNWQLVELVLP